jgi:two-component system, sensor histidine kinase
MDYQGIIANALPAGRNEVAGIHSRQRRSPRGATQHDTPDRGAEELLAMVCHELRSPVAAVRYAMRLWGNHAPEAPERQQLQTMIARQTGRMTRLIDDLLDVSRVTHERMQLHCELTDLRRIVEHAIDTVASEVDARGHQLISSAPDAPVWVTGDAFRLEQVFVNLLCNAAKYTEYGGRIAIHTDVLDNQAIVRVSDSGIGIEPQLLPHVFDLFRRAEQAGPQSRSGLGIGLSIVRSLVELHGGHVTATSNGAGHGSEFTVSLPRTG